MSYSIRLIDRKTGKTLQFDKPRNIRGSVYVQGGTTDTEIHVTYNYASWFKKGFGEDGIRTLYGKTGAESTETLVSAIEIIHRLPDLSDDERKHFEEQGITGYWLPTKDNALYPLYTLLYMALTFPEGVWDGD